VKSVPAPYTKDDVPYWQLAFSFVVTLRVGVLSLVVPVGLPPEIVAAVVSIVKYLALADPILSVESLHENITLRPPAVTVTVFPQAVVELFSMDTFAAPSKL